MAMYACQIGPTDTASPCPGWPHRACVGAREEMVVKHRTNFEEILEKLWTNFKKFLKKSEVILEKCISYTKFGNTCGNLQKFGRKLVKFQ